MLACDDPSVVTAFREGQQAWPGVSLTLPRLVERLAQLGATPADLRKHGGDLYLATACADGDPVALAVFEREFITKVDLFVARTGVPAALIDEVRQKVRVKLLTGPSPSIGRYRGKGALGGWVRVASVNVALDLAGESAAADLPDQQLALGLFADDSSPEMQTLRSLYRDRLREAVEESLAGLKGRDRTLLRLHFIDGLNIEAMGAIYRVHRATVARWLVALRERLFRDICRRLAVEVGGSPSEVRSLVKFLEDDIQVSARRLLANAG
jgi:RNA polymerase sigma-70 factor, ECF subfamily